MSNEIDKSKSVIKYVHSNITIPWFDYVYDISQPDMRIGMGGHSGVLSPLLVLDPKYNEPFMSRIEALRRVAQWIKNYPIAVRAIEWLAVNDEDDRIREVAQRVLDAIPPKIEESDESTL